MKLRAIGIRRFLQVSSGLIILGLLVEIVSLLWFRPLSFLLFVFVGVILIGLGIVVYLVSLVFAVSPSAENGGLNARTDSWLQMSSVARMRVKLVGNQLRISFMIARPWSRNSACPISLHAKCEKKLMRN
jgi:hypothetical protein